MVDVTTIGIFSLIFPLSSRKKDLFLYQSESERIRANQSESERIKANLLQMKMEEDSDVPPFFLEKKKNER